MPLSQYGVKVEVTLLAKCQRHLLAPLPILNMAEGLIICDFGAQRLPNCFLIQFVYKFCLAIADVYIYCLILCQFANPGGSINDQ